MRHPLALLLSGGIALMACTPLPVQPGVTGTVPVQISSPVKRALIPDTAVSIPTSAAAIPDTAAALPGTTHTHADGTLHTHALDVADIYKATVSVNGPGMGASVFASGNPIGVPNGQGTTAAQVIVPVGNNRIIKAEGLNPSGGALPSWYTVKGVTNVVAGLNPPVAVNWTTTPTAAVIEALIMAGSAHADTVNATQVQALVDQITVPAVAGANTTYTVHPSRVNASAIANAIIAAAGAVPGAPPAGSTVAAGTITGTISGLIRNQTATIVADDPASPAATTDAAGNYTINGVTPLAGITVRATNEFYDDVTVTTTVPAGGAGSANAAIAPLHYLPRSLYTGGPAVANVMRWSRMPIRILIVRPTDPAVGWTADHETAVDESLNQWLDQLGDKISYAITRVSDNDPALATQKTNNDLFIEWVNSIGGTTLGFSHFAGITYCGGCTPHGTSLSNSIRLATNVQGHALSAPVLRSVAAHEFGHSLGSIGDSTNSGHSDVVPDLMYPSVSLQRPLNLLPSARDYKTMRFLYSLPADITRLP